MSNCNPQMYHTMYFPGCHCKKVGETPTGILHISGYLYFRRDEFKMQLLQHLCTSSDCNNAWGMWYPKTADGIAIPFLEHILYAQKGYEDKWRASSTRGVLNELGWEKDSNQNPNRLNFWYKNTKICCCLFWLKAIANKLCHLEICHKSWMNSLQRRKGKNSMLTWNSQSHGAGTGITLDSGIIWLKQVQNWLK